MVVKCVVLGDQLLVHVLQLVQKAEPQLMDLDVNAYTNSSSGASSRVFLVRRISHCSQLCMLFLLVLAAPQCINGCMNALGKIQGDRCSMLVNAFIALLYV